MLPLVGRCSESRLFDVCCGPYSFPGYTKDIFLQGPWMLVGSPRALGLQCALPWESPHAPTSANTVSLRVQGAAHIPRQATAAKCIEKQRRRSKGSPNTGREQCEQLPCDCTRSKRSCLRARHRGKSQALQEVPQYKNTPWNSLVFAEQAWMGRGGKTVVGRDRLEKCWEQAVQRAAGWRGHVWDSEGCGWGWLRLC